MELASKYVEAATHAKTPFINLSKYSTSSENSNPNLTSPSFKISKTPNSVSSIRERKFVLAKRSSKREKERDDHKSGTNSSKCLTVAYDNLRASQDEFFMKENEDPFDQTLECEIGEIDDDPDEIELSGEKGSLNIKRRREKWLEEARRSVPETGCGRVMYLVKAFEKMMSIPKSKELIKSENNKKGMKWALPGLQQPKQNELQVLSNSFCPSDFSVTSESLGLDSRVSSSSHINNGSVLSRISGSGRKNRRNSSESTATSSGNRWKQSQVKAKPFKLRTEGRGKSKQEQLVKKLQQTTMEEEKQRILVAQGLPWTTDEPECVVKPPVKETTKPVDLVLHSDVRAMERAEFDQIVAKKKSLIEQYKEERERVEKLAEEEEIRRLRKELVPKAQPMPYFDRPFVPKRSLKLPTIPREPKFHLPRRKKIKF